MRIGVKIDNNIYKLIKSEHSISSTVFLALNNYLSYLDSCTPEELLKEVAAMLKLIAAEERKDVTISLSGRMLQRVRELSRYNIGLSAIVNRALQHYLSLQPQSKERRKRYCYMIHINENTLEKLRGGNKSIKYRYAVKAYWKYFELLPVEEKLNEIMIICSMRDTPMSAQNKRLRLCGSGAYYLDQLNEKYGLPRKQTLMRAIQFYKNNPVIWDIEIKRERGGEKP